MFISVLVLSTLAAFTQEKKLITKYLRADSAITRAPNNIFQFPNIGKYPDDDAVAPVDTKTWLSPYRQTSR